MERHILIQKLQKEFKNLTAVRAVASAIAANPLLITIPCHRVIGKDGKLTGFRGGLEMKKELLKLEAFGRNSYDSRIVITY